MKTLANTKLPLHTKKNKSCESVVSDNISICSTQLKHLGKIMYRSKVGVPQDEKEFAKKLEFANKLTESQRYLIDQLLGLEKKDSNKGNNFINSFGFEEKLEPDSVTLIDEAASEEEDEENSSDLSFINNETEESEEEEDSDEDSDREYSENKG